MTTSLNETNNMLRSIGLYVPQHDDRIFDPEFGHLAGYHHDPLPTVMDAAGWDDDTPVDIFMGSAIDGRFQYARGMGYDNDSDDYYDVHG